MVYKNTFLSRFLEKSADWQQLHMKGILTSSLKNLTTLTKRILRKTANESIPVSRQSREKYNPIWFNSDIFKLI